MRSTSARRAFCVALVAVFVVSSGSRNLFAQESKTVKLEHINPNAAFGISDVVVAHASGAKFIFLSGQVGFRPEGTPDDLGEQAEIAFAKVVKNLADAGAGPGDVVKINAYIKDLDLAKAQIVGKAKNKYFTAKQQPASTWVGVTGLVLPNLLVEVEVVAVVDQ